MIYKGKGDNAPGIEHAQYITRSLMDGLLSKGRTLFIDNFYSSMRLSRYLLGKSTYVCGTLRVNRKYVSKSVTCKKLKKGEVAAQQNSEGIKVMKWKDQCDVLMLTTVLEYTKKLVKTGKIKHGIEKSRNVSWIIMQPKKEWTTLTRWPHITHHSEKLRSGTRKQLLSFFLEQL